MKRVASFALVQDGAILAEPFDLHGVPHFGLPQMELHSENPSLEEGRKILGQFASIVYATDYVLRKIADHHCVVRGEHVHLLVFHAVHAMMMANFTHRSKMVDPFNEPEGKLDISISLAKDSLRAIAPNMLHAAA